MAKKFSFKSKKKEEKAFESYSLSYTRFKIVYFIMSMMVLYFVFGAIYRQVISNDFLQEKASQQMYMVDRKEPLRGMLLDRNGIPLAISSTVMTVYIDPVFYFSQKREYENALATLAVKPDDRKANDVKRSFARRKVNFDIQGLADILRLDANVLQQKLASLSADNRKYYVLKKEVSPQDVDKIVALRIPGVKSTEEYKRYYPQPEPNAQLIGMMDNSGKGIEGLEALFDKRLAGENGEVRILRDKFGNQLKVDRVIKEEKPGEDIALSLDSRLQYVMYRELARIGVKHQATYVSGVAVDVKTGEILAMNTWPSYNPNDKASRSLDDIKRNRGAVDQFEPGSTMKPFSVAMGLKTGKYTPNSVINTAPGWMLLGDRPIRDSHNYGALSLTNIIVKSSNVGVAKIALAEELSALPNFYKSLGFGSVTSSGLLGEVKGNLQPSSRWTVPTVGTMAYGYGLDVTMLQLVQAYAMLANKGNQAPLSILKVNEKPVGRQLLTPEIAEQVVLMMEKATHKGGTATAATIKGYRVAGKTGTARKLKGKGYSKTDYRGLFAGVAPVSDPRIAMVILVDTPKRNGYYGGIVAAPAFAKIMQESLRLLNVPFDKAETQQ